MNTVNGKDVFLWVFSGGAYILTACGKSLSMEFDVEDIAVATEDSGTDNDYVAGFSDGSVTFEGLVTIDDATKYQFDDWVDTRRVRHQLKVVFTDTAGNILQYEFAAKARKVGATSEVKSKVSSSLDLKICGPVSRTKIVNDLPSSGGSYVSGAQAKADWWNTTPGTNYVNGLSVNKGYDVYGATILMVWYEGTQYDFIGYTGTPTERQCVYNNSTQKLVFHSGLQHQAGATATILFE
jgi:predicted secreted protein